MAGHMCERKNRGMAWSAWLELCPWALDRGDWIKTEKDVSDKRKEYQTRFRTHYTTDEKIREITKYSPKTVTTTHKIGGGKQYS